MGSSRTKSLWVAMHKRCRNKSSLYHGARGIEVCDRWQDFDKFLADMGEVPAGLSLDRWPNNDGNYEPGNCRWATPAQQMRNTRRNRMLTYAGETLCMADWALRRGIGWDTLYHRLRRHAVDVALDPNFRSRK